MTPRTSRPESLPNPYSVPKPWSELKALGQNFLTDPNVPREIARAGGLRSGDVIFEIGADANINTLSE